MTSTTLAFLPHVHWHMGKLDVGVLFPEWEPIPPPPSQNAIGFVGTLLGQPAFAVCYFRKRLFSEKLARLNLTWWEERPPDRLVQATFEEVKSSLEAMLGPPQVMDMAGPTPPEFCQSSMMYWVGPSTITVLSCGLLQDGVPPTNPPLGLAVSDPRHDPMAQIFI